jgi:NADH-quinone oxidoreductase subunit H
MIVAVVRSLRGEGHELTGAAVTSGILFVLVTLSAVRKLFDSTRWTGARDVPMSAPTYVNPLRGGFPVPPLPGQRRPDPLIVIQQETADA